MAQHVVGALFGRRHHAPPYVMTCLEPGSLIMLSMASRKGRRAVRQMVLSQTEQGKGILRERQLRRMFTRDAMPGSLKNNGRPLAPFSPDAERARTCGLASIGNLVKHHPAASPKTVTLAISLLDRFLLKACKHPAANPRANTDGLEARTPFSQMGRQAALDNAPGNSYGLGSPALRQAIPLACFVLACKHVETWLPGRSLADVANLDSAFNTHCPCASKDVHDAELRVLSTLDWNIDPLSAIDIAQRLLNMAPLTGPSWQRAELSRQVSKELHLNVIIAALCKNLCRKTPTQIGTACLLDACQRTGVSAKFVPSFLQPENPEVLAIRCAISTLRPNASPVLLKWLSLEGGG